MCDSEVMRLAGVTDRLYPRETVLADQSREARGVVVTCSLRGRDYARSPEGITQVGISRMLATLKGYEFAGEYDPSRRYPGRVYFVPSDTLAGEAASALGIHTEDDLFGGVV